jgi:hypothetical protein
MSNIHIYLRVDGLNVCWISKPDRLRDYFRTFEDEIRTAAKVSIWAYVEVRLDLELIGHTAKVKACQELVRIKGEFDPPEGYTARDEA